jgi:hypothetical protein
VAAPAGSGRGEWGRGTLYWCRKDRSARAELRDGRAHLT